MNKRWMMAMAAVASVAVLILAGCEGGWTSGGETGFNTSRGAGVSVNFGGVYKGVFGGGKAVEKSSGAPITRLVITHGGDSLTAVDNNGAVYEGNIGSPGAVSDGADGVYPIGAEMVQSQVIFKGKDYSSNQEIEFVGIFRAIAVEDIRGETSKLEDKYTRNITWTTNITVSTETTNTTRTITIIAYDPITGNEVYRSVETITTSPQGTVIGYDYKVENNLDVTTTQEYTYKITEANTQYRLEGTWMEEGGNVSAFDAISAGSYGSITVTESATTGAD